MTIFPGAPRILKAAIVDIDVTLLNTSVIILQYNPEELTRSLKPQTVGAEDGGNTVEAMRLKGPPIETFTVKANIDAFDQLEKADPIAVGLGIEPQLATLEMLLYPKSSLIIANTALMLAGAIEIIPPATPFTLFIWGAKRVLPVRLTSLSIEEKMYDTLLNPIKAEVSLGMRVLSYSDLPTDHPGYYIYLANQIVKEALALIGRVNSLAAAGGAAVKLF